MPRELWAKIAVEIIRDPKLLARDPWERWLWLGLICLTKEMAEEDGILRGYDARALAAVLDLQVAPTKVRGALEAFAAAGMVVMHPDNTIELIHFKKRQALPKDSPEAVRKRQQEWRARHKSGTSNGSVTVEPSVVRNGSVTGQSDRDVTGPQSVTRNADLEEEEEEEKEEDLEKEEEEDRIFVDGFAEKAPPPPAPSAFSSSDLAAFLAEAWPDLPDAKGIIIVWRGLWPELDLLAEAKAAKAKEIATKRKIHSPGGYLQHWFQRAAADAAAGKRQTKANSAGSLAAPLTPSATSRMLDEKDRVFREEKARGTDQRALEARSWLYTRWPKDYPQYAPSPEASNA